MIKRKPSPVELASIKGIVAELSQRKHPYSEIAPLLGCSKSSIGMLMKHDRWRTTWVVEEVHRRLSDYLTNARVSGEIRRTGQSEAREVNMLYEPLRATTLRHLGWETDPFRLNVMADEPWLNADRKYAIKMIRETADEHGFTALIGRSGSGKSVCVKTALKGLGGEKRYAIIRLDPIHNEDLTSGRIIDTILDHFNLQTIGSQVTRRRRLKDLLERRLCDDQRTLLIAEEAHSLKTLALRWLKRFFELEDDENRRLLGILLVGQEGINGRSKGLKDELEYTPELREVAGRLAIITLDPLQDQLGEYLRWRIRKAGESSAGVFSADALAAMRTRLDGDTHPMMINVLASRVLNCVALENEGKIVLKQHVMAA